MFPRSDNRGAGGGGTGWRLRWLLYQLLRLYLRLPDSAWKQRALRRFSRHAGPADFPSRHGVRLRNRPDDYTFVVSVLGNRGDFVERCVERNVLGRNFVDIGANQGLVSLLAAKRLERAGQHEARVFSLEPNPFVFATLCENVALNGVGNVVPLCAAVVRGEAGLRRLSCKPTHSGGGSLTRDLAWTTPVLAVNHALLDGIADEVGGEFLVKIDVEGLEGEVVEAIAGSRIAARVSGVIVELHPAHNSAEELRAIGHRLERLGLEEATRSRPEGRRNVYFTRGSLVGAEVAALPAPGRRPGRTPMRGRLVRRGIRKLRRRLGGT